MTTRDGVSARHTLRMLAAGAMLTIAPQASLAGLQPGAVTAELIEAARQEGKVVFYTAIDLAVASRLAKRFEATYPGVAVEIERTGGERIFQRIGQERSSNIFAADVLDASDAALFIVWKRDGVLESFVPQEIADKWPAEQRDPDGFFASERFTLSPIAYNTRLVQPQDAPKSFGDLLDPKWVGKIVKAHPGYSGGIVTSTFQTSRALGWEYFQKLARQRVMQVQSATEPPKKVALGERAVMADGLEYVLLDLADKGAPVEIVYPSEGTPFLPGSVAIASKAPHPHAARLFVSFLFSRAGQQFLVDAGGMRSFHPEVVLKTGRKPLSEIKLMRSDPAAQEKEIDAIKQRYAAYFGV